MDWAYVIAALAVPAATFFGLRWWLARPPARGAVPAAPDQDMAELAKTVAAVQDRLTELSGQLESMRAAAEARERRLTGRLNSLLALTEGSTRIDLSFGGKSGTRGSPRQ